MRAHTLVALLLPIGLLTACGDKDPVDPGDDDTGGGGFPTDDTADQPTDADGDGWEAEVDCDDADAAVYPGALEECNGKDDDCNDVTDDGFPDTDTDGMPDCLDAEECDGLDNDGDGEIDEDWGDVDGDGEPDCSDAEECDGVDNDGDGEIDEGFDADGDGFLACGPSASDCDDADAAVNPDATEVAGNGIDDDCNGVADDERWDDASLIITEIMNNPGAVADLYGEWFEVYNPGSAAIDIDGLTIRSSDGAEAHIIDNGGPLEIAADGYLVLGINGDTATNGGIPVDYVYSGIRMDNEADDIGLYAGSVLIDTVAWDDGVDFPDPDSASMELDMLAIDNVVNDIGNYWCTSVAAGPGADACTPGVSGGLCPTVDRDGDGYAPDEGDCDDTDASIGPSATEVPYDGIDNDCDAGTRDDDLDEDGYDLVDDCDDLDDEISPDGEEVCDGVDNDCDGLIDDDDSDTTDADYSWLDLDLDGYGDMTSTPVLSCSGAVTGSGYADNPSDCDDTDASVNPDATETPYDGVDDDCDGADLEDVDRDGFLSDTVGGDDCDDTDAHVFPGAYEDTSDGVDKDCVGSTDSSDTDSYTRLSLSDDSSATITPSSFTFDYCGSSYSSAYVISNGRVLFGSSSTSYSESASTMASSTGVALLWDDLNPSSCGAVYWIEESDYVGVYFRSVCEFGTSGDTVTASAIFHSDGTVTLDYESVVNITDGLVGISCGDGTTDSAYDLSDDDWTDNALGLGSGTENLVHEIWTSGNDISGSTIHFCMQSGTDSDGDGWTDECGDQDDGDSQIYPR